ncbi:RagB/SusD family nutrient uptake outer membrane protein [Pedobacter chinensis]|uniref:RagB/SusD family nutrient uptake outer membrane protein n=1 Tax=Pedobacter chinensis TaxID=2282421 RepID=A0A369PT14_9SPHI|nr:RagB/SusD family nutrient uptake outer membrane protein [Pedobacter chinensis]RDC55432.1 RagB/SusD family nutrient uptake outer membrane protein [Pedobacter chinensis]
MKQSYKLFFLGVTALFVMGCEKYVDIKTQGNLVPKQAINYRYLLNTPANFEQNTNLGDFASDELSIVDAAQINGLTGSLFYAYYINSYTWKPVIYTLGTTYEQDDNWNRLYNNILYCNTIIDELPAASGTDAEKAEMTAEAKVHRADSYMALVNTYAKPYQASSAATDLGVPLILKQTVSQSLSRASVQAVYNQIIEDLTSAIPALPNSQAYNTLPSKVSAYGELARCYLYMNDYANANKCADMALAVRSTLNDLGVLTSVSSANYPRRITDPEILLSKVAAGNSLSFSPTAYRLSDEILALLGTTDQRYQLLTVPASTISSTFTGRYSYREARIGETRNVGPNVPEMMLIKAEYFARNNDATNAMLWVNNLRIKRFKPTDYVPLTASSPADALVKVIQERRREFIGRMLRWWDMRRLKSETAFQFTYTRVVNGTTFTLAPNSDRYVFPIAEFLTNLNPELEKNP